MRPQRLSDTSREEEDRELLRHFGARVTHPFPSGGYVIVPEAKVVAGGRINPWDLVELGVNVWRFMRPLLVMARERGVTSADGILPPAGSEPGPEPESPVVRDEPRDEAPAPQGPRRLRFKGRPFPSTHRRPAPTPAVAPAPEPPPDIPDTFDYSAYDDE